MEASSAILGRLPIMHRGNQTFTAQRRRGRRQKPEDGSKRVNIALPRPSSSRGACSDPNARAVCDAFSVLWWSRWYPGGRTGRTAFVCRCTSMPELPIPQAGEPVSGPCTRYSQGPEMRSVCFWDGWVVVTELRAGVPVGSCRTGMATSSSEIWQLERQQWSEAYARTNCADRPYFSSVCRLSSKFPHAEKLHGGVFFDAGSRILPNAAFVMSRWS